MSDDAKFKKEVQDRKKEIQGKKVELISRLCAEEAADDKPKQKQVTKPRK